MKIRIASSIALAAAIALGATGCSLIAPQGTLEPYAPSDGIEVNVGDVKVRNALLVADESGDGFNVVFTAVNRGSEDQDLAITFEDAPSVRAEFTIPKGTSAFGDPEGDETPVVVELPDVEAGATADAYFQVAGATEENREVPVVDGTLAEYEPYVLPADFAKQQEDAAAERKSSQAADDQKSTDESSSTDAETSDSSAETPAQ